MKPFALTLLLLLSTAALPADLPVIIELTEDDLISVYDTKFFRPVYACTPSIPAEYDGKYALSVVMAVNGDYDQAQIDAIATQIETQYASIHKVFILAGPHRIPLDRVPVGDELRGCISQQWDIETPVVE
jgi:hypothetical protein